MKNTFIIAEIGINHNGSISLAKEIIDAATECGVDAVKFQTYQTEKVMTEQTPLANYMKKSSNSNFFDMAKKFELSFDETLKLQEYTNSKKIEFMSSPFDVPSCNFLGTIGLKRLKIPSGETVNPFLLKAAAQTRLPLIVSTGMATIDEITQSINFLNNQHSGPITILHCTTQYPAEIGNCNLLAMLTMKEKFNLPIGYSDHTPGVEISLAAVAMGAEIIEKHFTIDKSLPGPDQATSLDPVEFSNLVKGIKSIDKALGNGLKKPFPIEIEVAKVARKSLITTDDLKAGTVLTENNLTAKRPGTGIPAMKLTEVINKKLNKDLPKNYLLSWDDIILSDKKQCQ